MNTQKLTKEIQHVFQSVLLVLPTIRLSRGNYALNEKNQRVGLHSIDATQFDLASLLWQASEHIMYPHGNHELLFNECWRTLRAHLDWNRRPKHSDAALCSWLDAHDKQWHIGVIQQIVQGEQYVKIVAAGNKKQVETTTSTSAMQSILEEYQ